MNKSSFYISLLALATSAAAIFMAAKRAEQVTVSTTTDVKAEEVSAILNGNPQMIISALQKYEQMQREAQAKEAARLFAENIEEINNNPNAPFVGPKNAKIVLVEFFDFSCGYCKRLAPALDTIIKNNPDVKVVFKPITFVSQISKYAAQAAVAANEQGKFMEMYDELLKTSGLNEAKINEIAANVGLNMDKYYKDVKSAKAQNVIDEVATLSEKLQIRGVPFLVLNGQQLQVIDAEGIQAEIDKLK